MALRSRRTRTNLIRALASAEKAQQMTQWWEPYEVRVSRTVLREREGEVPLRYSPTDGVMMRLGSCLIRALFMTLLPVPGSPMTTQSPPCRAWTSRVSRISCWAVSSLGSPYADTNLKEDVNYIFRTRSQINSKGEVEKGCYGRVRGEIDLTMDGKIQFSYWFNPDPNSRSLESDKKPY